ncbi:PD-(D/E)XK nuclease family protein [Desulfosoma sp.]
MDANQLKELIAKELPRLLREDPILRAYILDLTRESYADKKETDDRFTALLERLDRKEEEYNRRWTQMQQRWEETQREWNAKWQETLGEWNAKWEATQREWNAKWEENQRNFDKVHQEIMAQAKKFDRAIGALGARWGLRSEKAFRDALAGILEDHYGVQVLHVKEFDESGEVFGRPEQVELDIIVQDSLLIICELKSSVSTADMYTFERKARFYEKRHNRKADRLLVISPIIDTRAEEVARALGIKTYADSSEVEAI